MADRESLLRGFAQERIRSGKLPPGRPSRTYAGHGAGAECALCGSPINSAEVEYEMEFDRPNSAPTGIRMHLYCTNVWQQERSAGDGLTA